MGDGGPPTPKGRRAALVVSAGPLDADLLLHLDRLDLVADLDVVELAEADAGLEVRAHLGDVILEPPERIDGQVVADHDAVADDPRLGVSGDDARSHDDTGDVADLGGAE